MRKLTPDDIALVDRASRFVSKTSRVPAEELRSMAWPGLLRAARRFDPSINSDFEAYAWPVVVGEIRHRLRREYGVTTPGVIHGAKLRPMLECELKSVLRHFIDEFLRSDGEGENRSHVRKLEDRDEAEWALLCLSPKHRMMFRLIYWEGLSEREVASAFGLDPSRVSQILKAGRERMNRVLRGLPAHAPKADPIEVPDAPVDEPLLAL